MKLLPERRKGLRFLMGAVLLAACGGTGSDSPTLAERLQGNWTYQASFPDQGFLRTEHATLAVYRTSIQYNYYIGWECAEPPCPGDPPDALGGYFEGVFTDLGDSLALLDAVEPVAFRAVAESSFSFHVNGHVFPMRRN